MINRVLKTATRLDTKVTVTRNEDDGFTLTQTWDNGSGDVIELIMVDNEEVVMLTEMLVSVLDTPELKRIIAKCEGELAWQKSG